MSHQPKTATADVPVAYLVRACIKAEVFRSDRSSEPPEADEGAVCSPHHYLRSIAACLAINISQN
jgi:hypothetical protein